MSISTVSLVLCYLRVSISIASLVLLRANQYIYLQYDLRCYLRVSISTASLVLCYLQVSISTISLALLPASQYIYRITCVVLPVSQFVYIHTTMLRDLCYLYLLSPDHDTLEERNIPAQLFEQRQVRVTHGAQLSQVHGFKTVPASTQNHHHRPFHNSTHKKKRQAKRS